MCQDSPDAVEYTGIETVNSDFIYPCEMKPMCNYILLPGKQEGKLFSLPHFFKNSKYFLYVAILLKYS